MTVWRWLIVAAVAVVIGVLLFAHAADVDLWTWASAIGAAAFTALVGFLKLRRAAPPPEPVKEQARAGEAAKVESAAVEAKTETGRIVEHREEESKKSTVDRAQEAIDRNRARRP